MVAPTSVRLQLGNASDISSDGVKLLTASSPQEMEASRQGMVPSSVDQLSVVVAASDLSTLYNPMELANWVPFFQSNATVSVKVIGESADLTPIHTSFLLAGLSGASERKTDAGRTLTAIHKAATTFTAAPLKPKAKVTISLDDDEDSEMIDEDALLLDDVLAPPPAMDARTAQGDCAGRKPCDDCTCGRADTYEAASSAQNVQSSSCGNCALGDAFRCASCPYLGKPAFKEGEEHLVLDLTDDL